MSHLGVSIEGCKFVQLKCNQSCQFRRALRVSVEGCKFVQLKPSANHIKFLNFIYGQLRNSSKRIKLQKSTEIFEKLSP